MPLSAPAAGNGSATHSRTCCISGGLQQPGLTEPARETLAQIVRWPDREQRFSHNVPPVYAYSLESTVTQGTSSSVLPSNEILLLHYTRYGLVIVLCSPGSAVQSFESMEAFNQYWGERIASRYVVDTVTCQRYEIDGHAFDTQAAMILEQQLADVQAVQLPSRIGLPDLKTLYSELSDPARYLHDAPRLTPETSARLGPLLPEWLKKSLRRRSSNVPAMQPGTGQPQATHSRTSRTQRHQGFYLGRIAHADGQD
nr:hypothetical protein GCM10020185_69660 [Pseudomonas brassicacearum subsp. brassicacearum]